jgi:hypothetical protein
VHERAGDDAAGPGRKAAAGEKGANFRETLWFKKGDVEQMVAEAKAKAAATAPAGRARADAAPAAVDLPVEDAKPLEDRYLDDGSVTVDDRKKFSLRSGGTATGIPTVGGSIPGERMSESEMLNEMGGRRKMGIIAIAVVAVAALVTVLVVAFKGKGGDKGAPPTTEAANKPSQEMAPPKAPPPIAPEPAAASTPEPAHAKEASAKEGPSARARAAKRKAAAKKAAKKKH